MPESATECTASASIDDAPVMAKPTNLAVAMAPLASRAAMIARDPCPPVPPGPWPEVDSGSGLAAMAALRNGG